MREKDLEAYKVLDLAGRGLLIDGDTDILQRILLELDAKSRR